MQACAGRTARDAIARDGYALLRAAWSARKCDELLALLPATAPRAGGARNVLRGESAATQALDDLASALLNRPAFAVRAILFDKTQDSNWTVPWHQDTAIPLLDRHEVPGYRNWSMKEDVWHVQPPQEVLATMLTLRLHLDDCAAHNAPLQVLPGSHAMGRLDTEATAKLVAEVAGVTCVAQAGDVLAMRPVLLHASAKAQRPRGRRVLHVEYAAEELPAPLRWHRAWSAAQ
jgi:ectoine hydroxylase-related dioxygenase (phytanoyl-CoA dioxygenase family)